MAINSEGAERIVAEAVLQRLESPQLHDALAGRVRALGQPTDHQLRVDQGPQHHRVPTGRVPRDD
jgi:hypothetical protein